MASAAAAERTAACAPKEKPCRQEVHGLEPASRDEAGSGKVLTIAIPSYNVERYLEHGLESYCDDRLVEGLEVIVVDDGSTDRTSAIAQRFVDREPRVFRLVSKRNGGHGSAVNAGLAAATGRYFRVVDGDDWVRTDGLVELIELLRVQTCDLVVDKKREVHMVTGESELFALADGVESGVALPFSEVCRNDAAAAQIMIHTLTARTDYLRAIGMSLLEHTFYEDYEYIVKASAPARDIAFFDIEVYQYLVGNAGQSVSHANYVKRWADHTRVVDEMLRYLAAAEAGSLRVPVEGPALAYLRHKVHLIVDTHYNIALLFDEDRVRGRARAAAFRRELRERDPNQFALGEKRYKTALLLNRLGISYTRLEKLLARRGR